MKYTISYGRSGNHMWPCKATALDQGGHLIEVAHGKTYEEAKSSVVSKLKDRLQVTPEPETIEI